MRVALLFAALLATLPNAQQQEEPTGSHCIARCAAVEKDTREHRACRCDASKGKGCDGDGNRTSENMQNCVNRTHCLKGCCHCCPRD